jgi:hypothetical protein
MFLNNKTKNLILKNCLLNFKAGFSKFKFNPHSQEVKIVEEKRMNSYVGLHKYEFQQDLNKEDKKNLKRFDIYRFDIENTENPKKIVSYYVDLKDCGQMLLDALIKIKDEIDPSLTFRRSCREGICGSCSMNIDGRNTLACLSYINPDLEAPSTVYPLPYFSVLKDLVVDMTNFYMQYKQIHPVLRRKTDKVYIYFDKGSWTKRISSK